MRGLSSSSQSHHTHVHACTTYHCASLIAETAQYDFKSLEFLIITVLVQLLQCLKFLVLALDIGHSMHEPIECLALHYTLRVSSTQCAV